MPGASRSIECGLGKCWIGSIFRRLWAIEARILRVAPEKFPPP